MQKTQKKIQKEKFKSQEKKHGLRNLASLKSFALDLLMRFSRKINSLHIDVDELPGIYGKVELKFKRKKDW